MTCIIVDDELASRVVLEKFCQDQPQIEVKAMLENGIQALKYLNDNKVDLIFLDLHMDMFSGVDLLKTLDNTQKVILFTSDKDFASKSYEYENIVDYLVKPLTKERFEKAVERARKQFILDEMESPSQDSSTSTDSMEQVRNSLYINIDRRLINLQFKEIEYVEAEGDYVNVYTTTERYHVHTSLKKIAARLPEPTFMQIHRSYIINFNKIIDIQDNSVLIGKKVIPISRSNRPALMQRINLL